MNVIKIILSRLDDKPLMGVLQHCEYQQVEGAIEIVLVGL
jgi:hypothetical protein